MKKINTLIISYPNISHRKYIHFQNKVYYSFYITSKYFIGFAFSYIQKSTCEPLFFISLALNIIPHSILVLPFDKIKELELMLICISSNSNLSKYSILSISVNASKHFNMVVLPKPLGPVIMVIPLFLV